MVYPEHEKMHAVKDESQKLGTFLDWMFNERNWDLCYVNDDADYQLVEDGHQIQKILAEYFDIDLSKIEEEKQAMLEDLRRASEKT